MTFSKNEKDLLLPAMKNYQETSDRTYNFRIKDSNHLVAVLNSVSSLSNAGYICDVSPELFKDRFDVIELAQPFHLTITDKAIDEFERNL